MKEITLVEYAVIIAYFIFMVITGLAFRHFNKNFSDYFRGGCRGTWWLVGGSVFMTSFTAWTFTGAAGVAYEAGLAVAVIFLANGLGYVVNFALTAHLFRQLRAITFPEIIIERFDRPTQQVYVWLGLPVGIMISALTLWGVALFASSVFGFKVSTLIILLGVVILLYCTIGGVWSVMATDFLQALILVPMTLLVAYLSLNSIGGVSGLFEQIEKQDLGRMLHFVDPREGTTYSIWWAFAMILFVQMSYNSVGSSSKYFACKDGREARKAAFLAAVLMFGGAILWFLPPIVARLQFQDAIAEMAAAHPGITKPAEASYAMISMKLLPNGMVGMIVVAMFAATMSSLSTNLNGAAAVFSQDFYKPVIRRHASEREMFIVGQFVSLIFGALIVVAALIFSANKGADGLFEYMLLFGSILSMPTLVPMFLALFVKHTPRWSALFSVACSAIVSILAYLGVFYNGPGVEGVSTWSLSGPWMERIFSWGEIPRMGWRYEMTIFTTLSVGSIAFLATKPFYKYSTREFKEGVDSFYARMRKPVDFEKEVGQASDPRQLKLVGYVSLSIGIFVALILLVPNSFAGRLQVLFVSGMITLFGAIMVIAGHRKKKGPVAVGSPEGAPRDLEFPAASHPKEEPSPE